MESLSSRSHREPLEPQELSQGLAQAALQLRSLRVLCMYQRVAVTV